MKPLIRIMGLFVIFAASVQWMGCGGGGSSGDSSNAGTESSGSWYVTGFEWPHDGNPLESENFVIYSDGAGEDARQELAQLAEEILTDLKNRFAIDNNDIFLYPPGQEKIDIYAYKNRFPQEWGGWGYYGGFLIFSLDHPERSSFGHTEPGIYNPTVKHELMHVVESLLKGSNDPTLVDVWLTEGLAEAVSGGTAGGSITDLQKFNALRNQYGSLNPVAMHRYEDYPGTDTGLIAYEYLYPMFQLAVGYLVDANGHGGTMSDVKNLFLDVRSGVPFPTAFQNRFGMSLSEYESRFVALMTAYLP